MADDQKPTKPKSNPQTVSTKNVDSLNPNLPEKEVGLDDVIKKLTNEGQLIRNTGTNSLKSIGDKLSKFDGVFQSINNELVTHTVLLKNILNEAYISQEKAKILADEDRLLRSEEEERRRNEGKGGNGNNNGKKDPKEKGFADSFMGGGWISALLGIPVRAMFAVGALVGGDFITEYITNKAVEWGVPQQMMDAIAEPLKNGLIWGSIGLAISKRFGLYGLAAGTIWSGAHKVLDAAGITDETFMGLRLDNILSSIITGTILFASTRLGRSVGATAIKTIGGGLLTALSASPGLAKAFGRLGGGIAGIVATAIVLLEEPISNMLQSFGVSETVADGAVTALSNTAQGAAIGAMFGGLPGMVVGAALGLGYTAITGFYNWFTNEEQIAKNRLEDAMNELESLEDDPMRLGQVGDIAYARMQVEAARRANDEESMKKWQEVLDTYYAREGRTGISEADRGSFEDYMNGNIGTIEAEINAIAKNPDLSHEERSGQIVSRILDIKELFPMLDEQQIANELYNRIDDESWGSEYDGNDYLEDMKRFGFWWLNRESGDDPIQSVGEGFEEFKEMFKEHFGTDFDVNNLNDDQRMWIATDPESRQFWENLNRLQREDRTSISEDPVLFKPFRPRNEDETEEEYNESVARNLEHNAMGMVKYLVDMVEAAAVERGATDLNRSGFIVVNGGDTNIIATNNNQGGDNNMYGTGMGSTGRNNVAGGLGGK